MKNNYDQRSQPSLQASLVRWLFACSFMLLSLFAGTTAYSQCSGVPSSAGTASAVAASICSGSTASLQVLNASTDAGIVYQWYSSTSMGGPYTTQEVGATDTLFTTGSLTFNKYYVMSVKCSNTGDSVLSNEVAITVLPNLPVSVVLGASSSTVCAGGSVTLTASPVNGGGSPSYTFNVNGSPVQTGASATYTYTPANGDVVNVVINSNATCATGNPATSNNITITVNNLPSAPTISASGSTNLCNGGSVALTSSYTGGNVWSTSESTDAITVSTAGSYSVTYTDGNGCSSTSASTTVNTFTSSASIAPASPSFCTGGSVTLTASASPAAVSYLWSDASTASTLVATAAGIYTVTTTDGNGCTAVATTTVTENDLPVVSISGLNSFCTGSSTVLTANGTVTNGTLSYAWSLNGTPIGGANAATYTATAAGSYTVVATSTTGCSTTSAAFVVTTNTSSASISPASPAFCTGGSVTLTASASPAAVSYLWSDASTASTLVVTAAGTYTVTTTDGNGCTAVATTTVTENDLPVVSISGLNSFCTGSSTVLTANGTVTNGTLSYAWSLNGTPIGGANAATYTATAAGSYTVVATSTTGCSTTSAAFVVTVNSLPSSPVITPSGPTTFCSGGSVTLTSSYVGGNVWSTSATTDAISVSASGSYTVTYTDGNGCSATSAATVVTVNTSSASISPASPGFCPSGSVTLTASASPAAVSYLWSDASTASTLLVTAAGTYTVTTTDGNGCTAVASSTVIQNDLPVVSISGSNSLCFGSSNTLTANATVTNGTLSYAWSLNGTPIGGATSVTYAATAVGSYTVVATSTTGCSTTSAPFVITANVSPLAGTYTIGTPASCTQFTSLANFVSQINLRGISGPVILNVPAGYTETLTAGLIMTATGTLANPITIQKSGSGANPRLTAFVGSRQATSITTVDAMWSFVGSDYVTIDGIDLLDPVTNTTDITTMEVGYGFYKASGTDGANNNTVRNCTITLNRVNSTSATGPRFQGSNGIELMACTPSAVGIIITVTSIDGASSNNRFYSNTIRNVNAGISLSGFPGASPFTLCDFNNDIGGTSLSTGNTIINFGGGAGATNACAAVFLKDQWSANVSYNTVDNNVGGTGGVNHPATNRGIFANASSVGSSCTINNNNITITAGTSTSAISWCIDYEAGQSGANGNTVNINNNTISATNTAASTVAFTAIWVNTASTTVNVNNNNITKFAYAGTATTDAGAIRSGLAGIGTLNINNNTFSNVTLTSTTGTNFMIAVTGSVTTALNINGNNINGVNTTGATTKILNLIQNTSAATTATSNINTNNFQNITHAGSGALTCINATGTPNFITVNSNTFTNLSIATTGAVTLISTTFSNTTGTGTKTISNNSIVTALNRTGASGSLILQTDNGSSVTGTVTTVQNNNYSNITVTGTNTITGLNYTDGGTAPTKNFTGNTLSNWTGGTGTINCINVTYWNGVSVLSNNTITNINSQGIITGMTLGATVNTATSLNVDNNTISNLNSTGTGAAVTGISCTNTSPIINISNNNINTLSSTGASAVNGISIGGASNTSVFRNKIYNLSGSNASSTVNGILVSAGTLVNLFNNLVGDLRTPAANAANPVVGISLTGGTTHNVSYNTVYLAGTSTGAVFGSSAISVTATPTSITLRNNIFVNNTTPVSTGIAAAYRRSSTVLTNFSTSSNNNLYWAGTPSTTRVIMFDGTNAYQTLGVYKIAMATRDQASVTENPNFLSLVGANANYLHINPAIATIIEGSAVNISGITTDFDGQIRSGNAGATFIGSNPDIGADEGDFTSLIPVILSATSTLPTQQCVPANRTVSASVNAAGSALTSVVLNYAYNGTPQTAITMTGGTTTGTSTWTATLPSGAAPAGTLVTWSVVASNGSGSSTATGISFRDQSPTIATNPTTVTICPNASTTLGIANNAGSAISLNGTNQYVEVPNSPTVNLSGNVTLEAWVRPSAFTSLAGIISKYQSSSASAYFMRLSSVSPFSGVGIGNASELVSPAGGLTLNNWFHVAAVFNGTAGTIYINGVQVATNATLGAVTQSADPLRIGVDFFARYFNGQIDEVRIWNAALSVSTINAWRNVGISSSHPNFASLRAYYNFDEPSGNTVIDLSGNGNNGTIVNGATRVASGASVTPSGTYSWSPATNLSATNIPNPVCTPTASLATQVYTVTLTDAAGCTGTATTTVNTLESPGAPTSAGSTQCGAGIPSATVASTTSGVAFNWYLAPTGGVPVQASTATSLTSYSITATTTFYVSALNLTSNCESARTPVVVTVNQPDNILATSSQATTCVGTQVTLNVVNSAPVPVNNYTYTWNGPGVTNVVGSTITVNTPTPGTYNYTVTGVDGSCAKIATISFIVVAPPTIYSAVASPSTPVCAGTTVTLTALTSNIAAGNRILNDSSTTSATYSSPFYSLWSNKNQQILILASELTALGVAPGNLTGIDFSITAGTIALTNFSLSLAHTSQTTMATPLANGAFTTVYSAASQPQIIGTNNIPFSTPFNWDGVSNIVVKICFGNPSSTVTLSSTGKMSATTYVSQYVSYTTTSPGTDGFALCASTGATVLTYSTRPTMRLYGQVGTINAGSLNWVWNNGVSNFSNSNTTTVTPLATTLYTVTATDPVSQCSTSTNVNVTVNPIPAAPTSAGSTQCGAGVPTAVVSSTTSGVAYNWYLAPTGGTPIQSSTSTSLTSYSITTSTNFYVSAINPTTSCESARTLVAVTVTTAPIISITASSPICQGSPVTLTINDPAGAYTGLGYSLNGTVGGGISTPLTGTWTGLTQTVSVTPTASGSITYTLSSTAGVCTSVATVTVSATAAPFIGSAVASPSSICLGGTTTLTALTNDFAPGLLNIGGAGNSSIGGSDGNPYRSGNGTGNQIRTQLLVLASELTAAGMAPGNITSLAFTTTSASTGTISNFTISLGLTTVSALNTTFETTPLTQVFTQASFTPLSAGLNVHTFSTPFFWDGTSNLLINTCQTNNISGTATVVTQTLGFNANTHRATTTTSCTAPTGSVSLANRPIMQFGAQIGSSGPGTLGWVWNPGSIASNVATVTPTASGPQTYTVTATNAAGCTSTATAVVNVNPVPSAPSVTNSTQCGAGIPTASVASTSGATTPGFKWYSAPTGGTLLQGPPAATGSLVNYFANNFNGTLTGATLSGSASLTGGICQLTPNSLSQLGGLTIPASGRNADKYNVAFNLITGGGGGADGMSYSFGDDASATSTVVNAEHGSGTKLSLSFDDYDATGTGVQGIRLSYGTGVISSPGSTVGVNGILAYSSDVSWVGSNVPVVLNINTAGQASVTVNGVAIFTNVQLPPAYLAANKSNWLHVFKARTGGLSMVHAIDNLVIQQSDFSAGSSTYLSSVTATTSFWVSEINQTTGCEGPRAQVTVTVNQPDAVTVTASNESVCLGQPVTLTATKIGTTNTYAYTWNGTAGSGMSAGNTNNPVTVTPTTSGVKTYTLTAIDAGAGCIFTTTKNITVNPLPTITSATASPSTAICAGTTVTLTGLTPSIGAGSRILNDSSTTSTTYSSPFYSLWSNKNQQILILASELNAAGVFAGNLTRLDFSITAGTIALTNFSLSLAATAQTTMATPLANGAFTTVYSAASQPQIIGTNSIPFSTPFNWDGVSNIVVKICFGNPSSTVTLSSTGKMSATSYVSQYVSYNTVNTDGFALCAATGSTILTYSTRPTMRLYGQVGSLGAGSFNWVWNNGVSNFSNSNTTTVTPLATTNYTVTATDPISGCSSSSNVNVIVNPIPSAPTAVNGTRCGFGFANVGVTSTSGATTPIFYWYTTPTGGTPIQIGPSTTLNGYNVTANTTFYVGEVDALTGCVSFPRTAVLQTVTPADPLTITGGASSICLGQSLNFGSTQTGSTQNYTLTWTASPAVGSGLSAGPLGPVQTWYTNDFSSGTGIGTISGNASVTGGKLQLTPNVVSQQGGITIPNPSTISADALQVNFDLTLTQVGVDGADGLSYNFGDDVSATATVPNAENGTGTKLKVAFDSYGTGAAGQAGIYLMYNCNVTNQTPTTPGVLAFVPNTSFANTTTAVSITVTQSGLATVSLNGTPVISNVQLPAGYLAANRSTWQHVIKARTGGISQLHAIDNLVINYQTTISTPVTGSSLSVTPTIAGTYVYTLTGVDGGCASQTSSTVIVNPAAAAINAGADLTVCNGSSVTLNASGGGLIPALRFTEVLWQVNAGTGPTGASIPSFISSWYGTSTTWDMIEITNLGVGTASTDGVSIEFWNAASTTSGLPNYTYTIPTGAPLMNSGALLYFTHSGAVVTTDVANRFYTNGLSLDNGSGTAGGMIMRKNGVIIDAVAVNGYTFPAASGVTGSDWSGTLASNSGLSGSVLVAADNNTASSWANTSATQLASIGTLNAGLVANLPALGTVSWTSIPSGFTSTSPSPTFGPLTATTQFTVQFNNGTCSSFDDVNVTVITSVPVPAVTSNRDTICTIGSATFTISNAIPTASYQWFESTSSTGPWSPIASATGSTYTTPILAPILGDSILYYRVEGTCGSSPVSSLVRTLVLAKPFVTSSTSPTRCGSGLVTLSAVGNGTIEWYDAGSGGTLLGTGSPFNTNVVASTIYYAGAAVGTCRTTVRSASGITITPSTPITANATLTTVCAGQPTIISASSANSNYVYTWNGFTQGASQTVSPTTTTTYTVFANDNTTGCGASASVTINVNPLPTTPIITSSGSATCAGTPLTLTATSSGPGLATIGTAGTTNVTTGSSPYTGNWEGSKIQYLIRASELTAANIVAGPITSLAFNVTSATTTFAMSSYSIKMGTTAATALTAYQSGLSTVYTAPSTVTPTAGLNTYVFNTPFVWNGTSNIIVEVCHNNDPTGSCSSCYGGTSTVAATTTSFVSSYGQYADNTAPANPWDLCSQISTGTVVTSSARPDIRFNATVSSSGASTFNWSTGQTGSTVSVTPVSGPNTYTVTATSTLGCTSLPGSITITPSPAPNPVITDVAGNPVTNLTLCSPNFIDLYVRDGNSNGGVAPFSAYSPAIDANWVGLTPGVYESSNNFYSSASTTNFNVTVRNASGCLGTAATATVNTRSISVTSSITNVTCVGNNGAITVNVTSGLAPYTYVWSGPNGYTNTTTSTASTSNTITGLAVGTYTLDIFDNVGGALSCSATGLTFNVGGSAITAVNFTNVSDNACFGDLSGAATAVPVGGSSPYTYLWSPNAASATTATVSGLGGGNYTVTVTDNSGCSFTNTVSIAEPAEITAVITPVNECAGQSNGSASAVINGGPGAITSIEWYSDNYAVNYTLGSGLTTVTGLDPLADGGTGVVHLVVQYGTCSKIFDFTIGSTPLTTNTTTASACGSYLWTVNGTTYTSSGSYTSVIGCATEILNLTITPAITVSSFAPTSGAVGSSVVITGSGFTGATSVTFNGTAAVTYTVNSNTQITATVPTGATTGTITVSVGACSGTSTGSFTVITTGTLNLKAYIQGYLDVSTTTMTPVILNQTGTGSLTETDNITVEFHDATAPYALAASSTVMLNTDGTSTVSIPGSLIGGSYYIAIKHRSAIETWSSNPVSLTTVTAYDFTTSASQAFGDNMIEGPTGVWSLYTGDVDNTLATGTQDGLLDLSDFLLLDTDVQNFGNGYVATDLNGNGIVDLDDFLIQDANIQNFISTLKP